MKRLAAILLVLLITSQIGALAATITATGDVYLRSGPGLSYQQVTALNKGETASYLGQTAVDDRGVTWFKAFYNGKTGWVSSRYSDLDTWSWSYGYVTATASVWVRTGPGLGYEQIGALDEGDTLEYRNENSIDSRGVTWYKVYYGSYSSAWISSKYTTLSTNSSESVRATAKVYVRTGPGTQYDALTAMQEGDQAAYLGTSSTDSRGVAWYKVNYGGVFGWVSSTYSALSSGSGWISSSGVSYGTVEVTGAVWVRSGPGLDYDAILDLKKGATASYLGQTSTDSRGVKWYKVQVSDKIGWISSRYSVLK